MLSGPSSDRRTSTCHKRLAEALYSFASPDGGWCLAKKKARPRHVRVASFTKNLPGIFPWKTAGWIVWAVICHICHCSHVPGGRKIIPFSHKINAAICIMQMCKFSLVNSFGKRESYMFGSRKRMPRPENIFDVFPSISISSALRANRECLKGRSLSWTFLCWEVSVKANQGRNKVCWRREGRLSAEARLRPRKEEKEEGSFQLTCFSSSPSLQLYRGQGRAGRKIHRPWSEPEIIQIVIYSCFGWWKEKKQIIL